MNEKYSWMSIQHGKPQQVRLLVRVVTLVSAAKLQLKRMGDALHLVLPSVQSHRCFTARCIHQWRVDDLRRHKLGEYLMRSAAKFIGRATAALCFALTIGGAAHAQLKAQNQSQPLPLSLRYLLDAASATYPSLLAARLDARASNEDVSATERIRWPTVSATVESYSGNLRSYAALVFVGALVVMQGQMTMGALIASSILSGRILAPIMAIPSLLVQHAHAQAALEGLEKLYTLKTDHHGTDRPLTPSLINGHYALSDIKFSYGDNPPALVISKLEIQPKERIIILGPIGAGKSTLLRLLSGLYHPQEGRVLLDNLDLAHISRQVINQSIGYLQQDHRLFQGTLRENLLIGLPDPGDDALLNVMRRTGMDRFVASHPKGLDRAITEGGKGLSGGQKQLVAFTRLVLCSPNVMLLDEPTATMDDEQERRCLQVLAQEAQAGKSMIIVTHKTSILPLATRIMVIVGNSIVLDGPRDDVLQQLQKNNAEQQTAQTEPKATSI